MFYFLNLSIYLCEEDEDAHHSASVGDRGQLSRNSSFLQSWGPGGSAQFLELNHKHLTCLPSPGPHT